MAMPLRIRTAGSRLVTWRDRVVDAYTARGQSSKRHRRFTRAGKLALAGAVVPWVLGYIIAGPALYVFAYASVVLILLCYLLAPKATQLEATRVGLRPLAQQGDRLEVEVELVAGRSLSTFVLEERLPAALGLPVRVPIARVTRGSTINHRYTIVCSRRGVYEVGPLMAVTSDPLGLTQRETRIADAFELRVHPRIEHVSDRPLTRRFEDPPVRPPVSKPWPTGLEFYGMREYQPGDELRRIVWRASARMGKLMVREAEEGITDQVTVILDTDRGSHSWDVDHSESFETGVRVAASLAVRHLQDGYEVRCDSNGGRLVRTLRGASRTLELLDAFARVDMSREPLLAVLRRMAVEPRRDAHNILITPHLDDQEAAQLRLLIERGASILVVALLWDEESSETLNVAAALGCQVAGIRPGQDLASALNHDIGAGSR